MTTIIIKSFNRPHYLDRCLYSIYLNVSGKFEIVVIDDGTPQKYLDKIQNKYPAIKLRKSKNYDQKVEAIKENLISGQLINGFEIPINDWKEVVMESNDYILMTEDDVWFTKELNLDEIIKSMKKYKTSLIKLGWISNRPIKSPIIKEVKNIQFIKPKLISGNRLLMESILRNKYRFFSILYRLGLVDQDTKQEYWILNALLMGVFDKEYWLHVWSTLDKKVDETEQIINASTWFHNRKSNHFLYGKLNDLIMNTTFQSSATTSYHEHYGINLDINRFNFLLNEKWFDNELDVISDLPKDINFKKIKDILDDQNIENCTTDLWISWTNKFKEQYIKQGVNVD